MKDFKIKDLLLYRIPQTEKTDLGTHALGFSDAWWTIYIDTRKLYINFVNTEL